LPAEELVPLPGQISFDEAVATGLNALVARIALERLPIGKTDRILVRGAGGGIGLMCVQYARLRGGSIVATTSSRERGERLLALGATSIWNRLEEPDDDARIFELIVDTVMGKEFGAFFDMLTLNGQYLMCGGIGGLPPENFGMKMIEHFHKSPGLHAFSLNSVSADAVKRAAMALFQDVEAKRIAPVIDSILPLSQVVAAHEKLEAGRAFGKVILKPD
jgi:NADPH:quinone reductase-like Zn-dependent oxidoreductase